jgi:hypothetical protein
MSDQPVVATAFCRKSKQSKQDENNEAADSLFFPDIFSRNCMKPSTDKGCQSSVVSKMGIFTDNFPVIREYSGKEKRSEDYQRRRKAISSSPAKPRKPCKIRAFLVLWST